MTDKINEERPKCKCGHDINTVNLIERTWSCLYDDCKCKECHTFKFDNLSEGDKNWLLEHQSIIERAKQIGQQKAEKESKYGLCPTCSYPLGKIEGLRGILCFKCNFRKAMDLGKNKAEKIQFKFQAHYPCSKCNRVAGKLICVPCLEQENKAIVETIKPEVSNLLHIIRSDMRRIIKFDVFITMSHLENYEQSGIKILEKLKGEK